MLNKRHTQTRSHIKIEKKEEKMHLSNMSQNKTKSAGLLSLKWNSRKKFIRDQK